MSLHMQTDGGGDEDDDSDVEAVDNPVPSNSSPPAPSYSPDHVYHTMPLSHCMIVSHVTGIRAKLADTTVAEYDSEALQTIIHQLTKGPASQMLINAKVPRLFQSRSPIRAVSIGHIFGTKGDATGKASTATGFKLVFPSEKAVSKNLARYATIVNTMRARRGYVSMPYQLKAWEADSDDDMGPDIAAVPPAAPAAAVPQPQPMMMPATMFPQMLTPSPMALQP